MELSKVKYNDNNNKISSTLFKFAMPAIISLLVVEIYNTVDTIFTGRFVGSSAIAALTIAFPVQKLLSSIGMLVAVGASTLAATYLGSKDKDKLFRTIINAFILITFLLFVSVSIIYVFKNQIITAIGASKSVFPLADNYIKIAIIGAIFQCMSMVTCYIMVCFGYTRMLLYSNIIGVSINIILDYIFVGIFGFGVRGAAVSTMISQFAALVYAAYKFKNIKSDLKIKFSAKNIVRYFDLSMLKEIMAVGFTSFVIEISDAFVSIILNELLSQRSGDVAIIIVGIITKISLFLYITIIGISSAMQPIISYNYGAKNYDNMRSTLKLSIKWVIITSIISGSIFMIFANSIVGIFLQDKSMLLKAVSAFRISIAVYPIMGIYYVCIYYYQAINESGRAFFLSIYGHIIVFICVLLLLVNIFGVTGAWITYPVSQLITFATSVYYLRKAFKDEENMHLMYKHDNRYDKRKFAYEKI